MSEEEILFRLSQLLKELEKVRDTLEKYVKSKKEKQNTRPASEKQKKYLKDLRDKTGVELSNEEIERMDSKTASQWIDKLLKRRKK